MDSGAREGAGAARTDCGANAGAEAPASDRRSARSRHPAVAPTRHRHNRTKELGFVELTRFVVSERPSPLWRAVEPRRYVRRLGTRIAVSQMPQRRIRTTPARHSRSLLLGGPVRRTDRHHRRMTARTGSLGAASFRLIFSSSRFERLGR
jgi:hypothetical protein